MQTPRRTHEIRDAILTHEFYRSDDATVCHTVLRDAEGADCFLLSIGSDGFAELQSLQAATPDTEHQRLVTNALHIVQTLYLYDKMQANIHFLTTGHTWYESIIPGLRPVRNAVLIEEWRRRVQTNTWDKVATGLARFGLDVPTTYTEGIDICETGSAMRVLQHIRNGAPIFFADYEDELLIASEIGSLHAMQWGVAADG